MPCAGRSTADLGTASRRCTVIHNYDPGRFTGPGWPTASWPPPDASASDARPANGRWSPRGRIPAAHAWARRAPQQPAPLVCLEGSRARRGTHRDREAPGPRPDRDHITLRTSRAIRCANPPNGSPRVSPKTCCRAPPSSRAAGTATGAQEGSGEGRSTATAARSLCAPGAGSRGCDGTPPPAPARSRPGRSPSPGCSGTAPSRPRSPRASSRPGSARAGA